MCHGRVTDPRERARARPPRCYTVCVSSNVRPDSARDTDGTLPIWRAAQVFRLATMAYAVGVQIVQHGHYDRVALSWVLIALQLAWTTYLGVAYLLPRTRRTPLVVAEVVVTLLLVLSTIAVVPHHFYVHQQPLPTTFWVANAVVSVAILRGRIAGMIAGLVIGLVCLSALDQLGRWFFDATLPILGTVGLAIGAGAQIARRAHTELQTAIRMQAATDERDRLAREVHDGVLQVLALVRRRGREVGGEGARLAELAGEQEDALRVLLSRSRALPDQRSTAHTDLRDAVRAVLPPTATFAAPADAIELPRHRVDELVAVVRTALHNTERHAGPDASSYVLLEDLGDEVVLTVRDDGPGIPPGRLDQARAQGRMGVADSIQGRVRALGGTAVLETGPGVGTEWEIHLAKGTT
nr:DUF5931 domain-containing protein [Allobranchiibius huperziae]